MEGVVFSGEGKASEFIQIDEYSSFIQKEAGFKPFPGTLNLEVDPEKLTRLKQKLDSSRMESFERDRETFGGMDLYPVEIEGLRACIIEPDYSRYDDNVVEICSEKNLRSALELEDGDRAEIVPRN